MHKPSKVIFKYIYIYMYLILNLIYLCSVYHTQKTDVRAIYTRILCPVTNLFSYSNILCKDFFSYLPVFLLFLYVNLLLRLLIINFHLPAVSHYYGVCRSGSLPFLCQNWKITDKKELLYLQCWPSLKGQ